MLMKFEVYLLCNITGKASLIISLLFGLWHMARSITLCFTFISSSFIIYVCANKHFYAHVYQAWNVYGVLNYLQALVEKSGIIQILEQEKEGLEQFTATDGYDYSGGSNVLKVLGYFSMIGLFRVHCLLGDYHTGLNCLSPIDISQQGVYTSVIGSHITIIYHYGFASLMLRRLVHWIFFNSAQVCVSFC